MPNATDPASRSLVEVMEDERYARLKDSSYEQLFELALIGHRILNPWMGDITHIPITEFRAEGFVQEINRQVLHPAGLALEVMIEDDGPFAGAEYLSGVWDYRGDPEGILFGKVSSFKMDRVARIQSEHRGARRLYKDVTVDEHGIQTGPLKESN